jgi:hypothetical protein
VAVTSYNNNLSFMKVRTFIMKKKNIEKKLEATVNTAINYFDTVVTTTVNCDTLAGMRQLYAARVLANKQAARIESLAGKADKVAELEKAKATKASSDLKNLWLTRYDENLDNASDAVKYLIKLGCGEFDILNIETQKLALAIIGKVQAGENVTGQDVRDFVKSAGKQFGVDIVPAREQEETISQSFYRMTYKDYKASTISADGKKHCNSMQGAKFVKRSVDDFKKVLAIYIWDSWLFTCAKQVLEEAKQANA